MKLIDLTFEHGVNSAGAFAAKEYKVNSKPPTIKYTGICYNFEVNSMAGTYIDFPGHVAEMDDGQDAKNYPLEKLFRRPAKVIHLDQTAGAISAKDLDDNCPCKLNVGDALIINARGKVQLREFANLEETRALYLDRSAVDWIIEQGVELLISDVYESIEPTGVFYYLFEAGITTVCNPVNMDRLTAPEVKITILSLLADGVVQIPCRMIAEVE